MTSAWVLMLRQAQKIWCSHICGASCRHQQASNVLCLNALLRAFTSESCFEYALDRWSYIMIIYTQM